MEHDVALARAWNDLSGLTSEKMETIRFMADTYEVDLVKKSVMSVSCNVPAKAFLTIIILHYLRNKIISLPKIQGEWIAFHQLVGGEGYSGAFKKRVINRIKNKYGDNPDALIDLTKRFKGAKSDLADVSIVLEVFDNVPILIQAWRADEEFEPLVDLLYDRSIEQIFCTEDVAVLSEILVSTI